MSNLGCCVCGGSDDVRVHAQNGFPCSDGYCRPCDEVGAEELGLVWMRTSPARKEHPDIDDSEEFVKEWSEIKEASIPRYIEGFKKTREQIEHALSAYTREEMHERLR